MRRKFVLLLFIICVLLMRELAAAQQIPWKSDYYLVWSDFQGPPDPGSSYAACTHYDVSYNSKWDHSGAITVTVACSFDKSKSWKRPERNLTPKLLLHEEIHFYIAELYARKMRQAFALYASSHKGGPSASNDLNGIYGGLFRELQECNNKYDEETSHSMNEDKQKEWTKKIVDGLKELSAYEAK